MANGLVVDLEPKELVRGEVERGAQSVGVAGDTIRIIYGTDKDQRGPATHPGSVSQTR